MRESGVRLPFAVEVVGFSDEEGVRYQSTYLGSGAMAGTLTKRDLAAIEEKGIERARRKRGELLAYAEVHIEQGPVLEARNLALGVVSGIAGQTRVRVEFTGRAGHAGTTPMDLRRDALCAAAEFILAVERAGVTATVGQIDARPGASNVIPGQVTHSLDVRDFDDGRERRAAVESLRRSGPGNRRPPKRRFCAGPSMQDAGRMACDPKLDRALARGRPRASGLTVPSLPSGAGHDAAALAAVCPTAMMFVRCKGAASAIIRPNPSRTADVAKAVAALRDFVLRLARKNQSVDYRSADWSQRREKSLTSSSAYP